jgi:hypothetical protein
MEQFRAVCRETSCDSAYLCGCDIVLENDDVLVGDGIAAIGHRGDDVWLWSGLWLVEHGRFGD